MADVSARNPGPTWGRRWPADTERVPRAIAVAGMCFGILITSCGGPGGPSDGMGGGAAAPRSTHVGAADHQLRSRTAQVPVVTSRVEMVDTRPTLTVPAHSKASPVRRIPVLVVFPVDRRGRLPLVVFLHGLNSSAGAYTAFLDAVAGFGYVVAAHDIGYNTCCRDPRIRAVLSFEGALLPYPNGRFVWHGPPLLMVVGTRDPLIPLPIARKTLGEMTTPADLLALPGADHTGGLWPGDVGHAELLDVVKLFLAATLGSGATSRSTAGHTLDRLDRRPGSGLTSTHEGP